MLNRIGKYKKVKVAVASDIPVWMRIQLERELNNGGKKQYIGVSNGVGLGLKVA